MKMVKEKMVEKISSNKNAQSRESFSEKLPEIRVLVFDASAYSHIYNFAVLFSIKKRKFIKPYWKKHQQLEYHVFPGSYILIKSRGYLHDEPMTWTVSVIYVKPKTNNTDKYDVLSSVTWQTPWDQKQITVPILKDIDTPGYHGYPKMDYNKVYSQAEIDELLKGGIDPALKVHAEE